jgi:hypothetical protein
MSQTQVDDGCKVAIQVPTDIFEAAGTLLSQSFIQRSEACKPTTATVASNPTQISAM